MTPQHNLHIHSLLSNCASREMTIARVVDEAERAGLETVCISDHIDRVDPAREAAVLGNFAVVRELRPSIRVLVGCEVSQIRPDAIAVGRETARRLDFVLVAANHYHLDHVENPVDRSPAGYAAHYLRMVEGAIDWGCATAIAHPFLLAKVRDVDHQEVLASYDRDELRRILQKAAERCVAFELNPGHVRAATGFFEELVAIGQSVGVKFAPSTDAHQPEQIAFGEDDLETLEQIGIGDEDLIGRPESSV